eukprot:NODE_795_length_4189_cov_0.531785.p4 type:complete len:140 gc:universal NODE_795_length_4189_cov_0.531785:3151-2732(-)
MNLAIRISIFVKFRIDSSLLMAVIVESIDQQHISDFANLNDQKVELAARKQFYEQEKEYTEDLEQEYEIMDEPFYARFGDGFVELTMDEFGEELKKSSTKINSTLEKVNVELFEIEAKMAEIKTSLYAKFGTEINLEYS